MVFSFKMFIFHEAKIMCGAPERLTALGAHTFQVVSHYSNNGSECAVVKQLNLH
jgi:hypothetical protein